MYTFKVFIACVRHFIAVNVFASSLVVFLAYHPVFWYILSTLVRVTSTVLQILCLMNRSFLSRLLRGKGVADLSCFNTIILNGKCVSMFASTG